MLRGFARGGAMGEEMMAVRGTLALLRTLSEGPASKGRLLGMLEGAGIFRDERTVRRWLKVLRDAGFEIERKRGRYELGCSPARLAFTGYEALASLSVLEALAEREPVYGEHLASAAAKLLEPLPKEALRFADGGEIEFAIDSASDPPEDPDVMDALRRAVHQHRRVEILYHSLNSNTVRQRLLEPIRVFYGQRAHRLYAYEPEQAGIREFRVNRIKEATMLPEKFAPEAHSPHLEAAKVRLSKNAFVAYGSAIVPGAKIDLLDDGGAILTGTTPSTFWSVREISSLGPDAEVLGGPALRQEYLSFLRETLANHG